MITYGADTTTISGAPQPQKRRDYKPAPGRVTVLREVVSEHYNEELGLAKPVAAVERDRAFAIFATVAKVGDPIPGGIARWFDPDDVVSIEPSMFTEVQISPRLSVWVGPWAAVTGKFEDVPEE